MAMNNFFLFYSTDYDLLASEKTLPLRELPELFLCSAQILIFFVVQYITVGV